MVFALGMKIWAFPQGQWGATAGVRQELTGSYLCRAALPLGEGRRAQEQALPASPCSPRSQPWAFSVWGSPGSPRITGLWLQGAEGDPPSLSLFPKGFLQTLPSPLQAQLWET